jgi:hypothetical protein
MRLASLALAHIALVSCSAPLVALTPEQARVLEEISRDPQTKQEALARLKSNGAASRSAAATAPKVVVKAQPDGPASSGGASGTKQTSTINAVLAQNQGKPWYEKQYSTCPGFSVLLRQSWSDFNNVAGFECAADTAGAQGAQISYSDDRISNNRQVAIQGTAAVLYNSVTGNPPSDLIPYATSFGAYVSANDLTNSAKTQIKSNKDSTSYGGVLELGFISPGGSNTFRILGGGSDDNLAHTTSGNAVVEWYPVYYPLYIHTPISQPAGLPIILRFDPDVAARYDGATGANQIVPYNNRQESMRLGPELSLKLLPYPTAPAFLANLSALVEYDWYYESYTRKDLNWFTSSVTYNLDAQGHVGITGKYERGRDAQTGASTNFYTVGLSGKL